MNRADDQITPRSRRALITGAASGIGLATASVLISKGVSIIGVDVDSRGLDRLGRAGVMRVRADVATELHLVDEAVGSGSLDYLINCAGVIRLSPLLHASREDWERILSVNAEAVFFLSQMFADRFPRGGAIVNIASSSAKLATTTEAAIYAASKAAVLSITRSFAYELAPRGIRVNAVCPGIVDTPMERGLLREVAASRGLTIEELEATRHRTIPLGRAATAEEVAEVIWFLLSERSSYMTGQAINVTGGQVMW